MKRPDSMTHLELLEAYNELEKKYKALSQDSLSYAESKKSARELGKDEEVHQLAIDRVLHALPETVYWMDHEGRILGCNDKQAKFFGLEKADDMVGKNIFDVAKLLKWPQGLAQKIHENDLEVMQSGKGRTVEETFRVDGVDYTILASKHPLHDESGEIRGVFGIGVDITERKHMEEDLIRAKEAAEVANETKDQFILDMTHDFKTPLTGLEFPSETLYKARDKLDPKLQDMAELIYTSTRRMSDLVTQILDFSRVSAGKIELRNEKVNLGELIRLAVDNTAAKCHSKDLELVVNYPPEVPRHIISDSMHITRILLNLISNAIRYTEEGTVTIKVEQTPSDEDKKVLLKISITDTGIGIPEDKLKMIFERFNRVEASAKLNDHTAGVGLGLSIVQQFVKTLDGTVDVKSQEGVGSTFTVTLPIVVDEANTSLDNFAEKHPELAVLFISDNTAMAESMAYQLITPNFDMYHINHVEAELKKAKEQGQQFAIILLDAPAKLDPVAFKAELKSAPDKALWVLLTKPLTQAQKTAIIEAGFTGIIQKPVLPEELHQQLQDAYESHHKRDEPNPR